jgi:hypothetical protein
MSEASRPSRPPPTEYAFSEAHRESFRSLAQSMSFVGVWSLLLCGLGLAALGVVAYSEGAAAGAVGAFAGAAVCVPSAWWTMSAGRALGALVRTQGRDVPRLMEAVGHLRLLFSFARVVILVLTLLVVLVTAGVVWCMFVGQAGGRCLGVLG